MAVDEPVLAGHAAGGEARPAKLVVAKVALDVYAQPLLELHRPWRADREWRGKAPVATACRETSRRDVRRAHLVAQELLEFTGQGVETVGRRAVLVGQSIGVDFEDLGPNSSGIPTETTRVQCQDRLTGAERPRGRQSAGGCSGC